MKMRFYFNIGMLWCLKRRRYAGKVRDFSGSCPCIQAFYVPGFTHLERAIDIDLYIILPQNIFGALPVLLHRGDKGRKHYRAGIDKQLPHLGDPAYIFRTRLGGKAQIFIKPHTDVIAI